MLALGGMNTKFFLANCRHQGTHTPLQGKHVFTRQNKVNQPGLLGPVSFGTACKKNKGFLIYHETDKENRRSLPEYIDTSKLQ